MPSQLSAIDDQSERRAADERDRSDRDFQRIIDNLIDTFYRTDLDGRIVIASQAARDLLGCEPADLLGRRLADFYVDPQGREKFLRTLQASGGKVIGYEAILRRPDGGEVWVETNAHYVRDDNGDVTGVEGTVRNITHRRRTEKALRDSEERFRRLHELSTTAIAIHENGIILDANRALTDVTGYTRDELIGMDGLLLVAPQVRAQAQYNIRTGFDKPYLSEGLRKDGSVYPLEITGKNVPYNDRTLRVTQFDDITDRRRQESERDQLHLQLQQAQKMEAIGQLTGGIAHDFNNIMTAVLGYARLARALHVRDTASQLGDFLDQIIRSGDRAANLVSQMMAFSRGGSFTDLQSFAPTWLMNEALKMLRPTLPSTIEIKRLVDDVAHSVHVDPVQIHQVLTNMIINARDAMGERGKLTLGVRHLPSVQTRCASCHGAVQGEWMGLVVADDGPGIDTATLQQIFQPFFTTKDVGKGTGMGLSVAHGIVHRMNGHILVDSAVGSGSTFTVLLPPQDADSSNAATASDNRAPASTPRLSGLRVLVIDDEAVLCNFYREALQVHGCVVTTHMSSPSALQSLEHDPYQFDVVLTDQTMPGLTGRDVLLRAQELRPELPVILCSGYSAHLDAAQAAELGAADYLAKPIELDTLLCTLARVSGRLDTKPASLEATTP